MPYLIEVGALKVTIEAYRGLDRVKRDLLTLGIYYVGRSCSPTKRTNIHASLKISFRLHHAFIYGAATARCTLSILVITCVGIWWSSHKPNHPFDGIRVRWQVRLVLSTVDDLLVVRPTYFLIRQEVVAGLLLLTLYLMLQTCGCICKPCIA